MDAIAATTTKTTTTPKTGRKQKKRKTSIEMRIGRRTNDTSEADGEEEEGAISRQGSNKSVLYQVLEEEGGENENIYKEIYNNNNRKESNAYQTLVSLSPQNYAALSSAYNLASGGDAFQQDVYADLKPTVNNNSHGDQSYMSLNMASVPPADEYQLPSEPTHCHEERHGCKYDTDDYVDF